MDTLEDTGSNTKISDSVYSNSCSNSQSRSQRSHSGSNSSGSSGYGGKPSTSGSSSDNLKQTSKKDKKDGRPQSEAKAIAKDCFLECLLEGIPPESIPFSGVNKELTKDVFETAARPPALLENGVECMKVSSSGLSSNNDKKIATIKTNVSLESSCEVENTDSDGFSCAISIHDGVVIHITGSVITKLGFPKDLWIGRSFIEFIHPKDHSTFVSQITRALAIPAAKDVSDLIVVTTVKSSDMSDCSMVCRIRCYRSLKSSFGVKNQNLAYLPFVLNFSFNKKDGNDAYLIIKATSVYSAFKTRNEGLANATPFIMRHSAAGIIDYIDIASVPYLGYLPQEIKNQNVLRLCHPEDLRYLGMIYETLVKKGSMAKSLPYRMLAQNGDYVKLQTEWSTFTNPWSKKLEFVIGKYYILEGPTTPDVFKSPQLKEPLNTSEYSQVIAKRANLYNENILTALSNILRNPEEDKPKVEEKPKVAEPNPGPNTFDKDSVMLAALSPHSDCMTSVETPMSYNQLNYKENLQRYFDSHQPYCFDENISLADGDVAITLDPKRLARATSNSLMCPLAHCSGELIEKNCPSSPSTLELQARNPLHNDFYSTRLTETLLTMHNTEMQKNFARNHRDCRNTNKSENASDSRQKTMEHLARCNASFQPTTTAEATQLQGFKRASNAIEEVIAPKRPSLQPPSLASCQVISADITAGPVQPTTTVDVFPMNHPSTAVSATIPMDSSHWTAAESGNIPQAHQIPAPLSHQMQLFPSASVNLPYSPPAHSTPYSFKDQQAVNANNRPLEELQPKSLNPSEFATFSYLQITKRNRELPKDYKTSQQKPFSPEVRSGLSRPHSDETVRTDGKSSSSSYHSSFNTTSNSAGNSVEPKRPRPEIVKKITEWKTEPQKAYKTSLQKTLSPLVRSGLSCRNSDQTVRTDGESSCSSFYSSFFNTESSSTGNSNEPKKLRSEIDKKQKTLSPLVRSGVSRQNSDQTVRTDGESSCSSYYSSFFNTECSSTGNSNELIRPLPETVEKNPEAASAASSASPPYYYIPENPQETMCRSMSELANMNEELAFRYQIPSRSKDEVLKADEERFENWKQPPLVKEQLGQMFLQMQLNSRMTLEDGTLSSGRSSDESIFSVPRRPRLHRKRSKSRLQMIYEEDAPIPSPPSDLEASSSESSKSPPADFKASSDEPSQSPPTYLEASSGERLKPLSTDLETNTSEPSQSPPADFKANSDEQSQSPPTHLEASSSESSKSPPADFKVNSDKPSQSPPNYLEASSDKRLKSPPIDFEAGSGEPSKSPPADLRASSDEPSQSPPTHLEAISDARLKPPSTDFKASSDEPSNSPTTDLDTISSEPSQSPPTYLEASSDVRLKPPTTDFEVSLGEPSNSPTTDTISSEPSKAPPTYLEASSYVRLKPSTTDFEASSAETSNSPTTNLDTILSEPSQSPPIYLEASSDVRLRFPTTDFEARSGEPSNSPTTVLDTISSEPSESPPTFLEASSDERLKPPTTDHEASSCDPSNSPTTDLETSTSEPSQSPPYLPQGKIR